MLEILIYMIFLMVSMVGAFLSKNWFLLWLFMELKSLCLIPMMKSNASVRCLEATSKYYMFQALGSVILLLGVFVRFLFFGELELLGSYKLLSSVMMMVGLAMKVGVFPLHFWFMDVMSGLKLYEGVFVVVVSKMIPVYLLMMMSGEENLLIFWFMGLISVIIGSVFGMSQIQLRKILGLSSVSHLGWLMILFPMVKMKSSIFLFLIYVVMMLPIFWIGKVYSVEHFYKVKGMWKNSSFVLIFSVSILSLSGFPPLLGFFYKGFMLYSLAKSGSFLIVIVLMILSLVSLYFYLNLVFSLISYSWPKIKFLMSNSFTLGFFGKSFFMLGFIIYYLLVFMLMILIGPLKLEFFY